LTALNQTFMLLRAICEMRCVIWLQLGWRFGSGFSFAVVQISYSLRDFDIAELISNYAG